MLSPGVGFPDSPPHRGFRDGDVYMRDLDPKDAAAPAGRLVSNAS